MRFRGIGVEKGLRVARIGVMHSGFGDSGEFVK